MTTDASRAFAAAVEAVREGKLVVVYPEGTLDPRPRPVADGRARPARRGSRWRPGCP